MIIKILGSGCSKCNNLENNVKQAVKQISINAEVIKITDIKTIMNYKIMMTPALIIDEKIISAGKVLEVEEIIEKIKFLS